MLVLRISSLRNVLMGVLNAGLKISRVLLLIVMDVLFFSFVGFVMFSSVPGAKSFSTYGQAFRSMLLILTAPGTVLDAMTPIFEATPLSSLFFVFFVIFTTMLLQKLVLATAYRSYKGYQKANFFARIARREQALVQAYGLVAVDNKTAVHRTAWRRIYRALGNTQQQSIADAIFRVVDTDGSGTVEEDEFLKLCSVGLTAMGTIQQSDVQGMQHGSSSVSFWGKVRAHMRYIFEYEADVTCNGKGDICLAQAFVDIFVLASIAQLYCSVTDPDNHTWHLFGIMLLLVFSVEVLLRWFAFGWREYISEAEHKLDVLCVLIGSLFFVSESLVVGGSGTTIGKSGVYRFALVLRTLRALRFLWVNATLHGLLWCLVRLTDSLLKLFFVMFIPIYVIATVAEPLFGSSLVPSNPLVRNQTKWFPYHSVLNFESTGSSLLTLWEISTISSWPIIMNAVDASEASAYTSSTEVFFFGFRILMTMIFIPVLTGFVIEAFVTNFSAYDAKKKLELEQRLAAKRRGSVFVKEKHQDNMIKTVRTKKAEASITLKLSAAAIREKMEKSIYNVASDLANKKLKVDKGKLEQRIAELTQKLETRDQAIINLRQELTQAENSNRKKTRSIEALREKIRGENKVSRRSSID